MAWRIDEAVIRGEIDNRTRGRVTGRLWMAGVTEPVVLDLAGDCHRDLAGRFLEFANPLPKAANLTSLAPRQQGCVGDMTASRKVRVPDIPLDQIGEYTRAGQPFPSHWGNALYLEWFSDANGRVVIETASFELRIIGDSTWEMTVAEDETQRIVNACTGDDFQKGLGQAPLKADSSDDDLEADEQPCTEEEAEQMQARCDLLADRIQARIAREGEAANYGKILEEEIIRLQRELGETPPTPEQLARNAEYIEELNRVAANNQNDPEAFALERCKHPLAERAFRLTFALSQKAEEFAWIPAGAGEEHPVAELVGSVMKASAKLASALHGERWPPPLDSCGSIIVRLKRARVHLDDALRAMETCQEDKLIPLTHLGRLLVEVVDLAHDADEIIAELRELLSPDAE